MNAAVNSYGVHTNWYIDTGATDHITSELDKLHWSSMTTTPAMIRSALQMGKV